MKKSVLALLLVTVVLVLVVALALRDGGGREPQRAAAAPGNAAPAKAGEPALLERPGEVPVTPVSLPGAQSTDVAAVPAPGSGADERRAVSGAGGRRVRGSVFLPPGTPADDTLRVLALASSLAPRRVYGEGGVLDGRSEQHEEGVLTTGPVAPDGTFELALGTPDEVWLAVDGRFLFSPSLERLRPEVDAVTLTTELGACVRGRVRLSGGSADPAASFESMEVQLGIDSADFSMGAIGTAPVFSRRVAPDAEGRFEFRAVPAGHTQALEVDADDHADAKLTGLKPVAGQVLETEVTLQVGATLRGRVVDASGAGLPGARVVAAEGGPWGFDGERIAEGESGEDGSFELTHVTPGSLRLVARANGYLENAPLELEVRDRERREDLLLAVDRGASVSGVVRLPGGQPASGAEVEVDFDPEAMMGMGAMNAARGAEGEARCGEDGTFTVTGLGKGPFVVAAELERRTDDGLEEAWRARLSGVKPGTRELELVLARPSTLTGRVVDAAGAPVPEFRLSARKSSGVFFMTGEEKESRFEDEQGAFRLGGLDAGEWSLVASADGFGPMTPVELTLPGAEATPLELVLEQAASISGKVLDPSGAPLPGAHVELQAEDMGERIRRASSSQEQPGATSKADGTFLMEGLGAGTVGIVATHADHAASEPVAVETSAGAPASGVVLRLRHGARVTGEVFGVDGKPATGVQVVAQESGTWEMNMKRTDGEGRFEMEHMTPGSWTISAILSNPGAGQEGASEADASAAFLNNMRMTMVQLEDSEEEHVVLGAPPRDPVVVHGRVVHGGGPVESGLVTFLGAGSKGLESMKMAPLGSDGTFQTRLDSPGRYVVTVQVTSGGGSFQQHNVEFRETIPEAPEHELELELPLGAVRGLVRGHGGQPLANARVTLVTEGGLQSGSLLGGHYSEATTDDAGRYAFEYLRPGTYSVAAGGALFGGAFGTSSPGGRALRTGLRVEEGRALEGIDFRLEEPGDLTGIVRDGSGAPVKDAGIFVRDEAGNVLDRFSMITSGPDGSFTYTGVSPGSYTVSARGKGMASADSAPVRVRSGEKGRVELVVYPGTRLVVEVIDGDGEPLEARVTVVDAAGREMQGIMGFADMASSFGEGLDVTRHSIGPLPPGAYTVVARTRDGRDASRPVTLDGQDERRLRLRVR